MRAILRPHAEPHRAAMFACMSEASRKAELKAWQQALEKVAKRYGY